MLCNNNIITQNINEIVKLSSPVQICLPTLSYVGNTEIFHKQNVYNVITQPIVI